MPAPSTVRPPSWGAGSRWPQPSRCSSPATPQGKLMFHQQPMKMASAESLCDTADRSRVLHPDRRHAEQLRQPHPRHRSALTSCRFWPKSRFHERHAARRARHSARRSTAFTAPNDYRPNLFVTYWSFRAMIGLTCCSRCCLRLPTLWLTRGGRIPNERWFSRAGVC